MSKPLRFAFELGATPTSRPRDPEQPLRILVMGNFSGRTSDAGPSIAERRIRRVDVDNFEDILKSIGPMAHVPIGDRSGANQEITFEEIDDFHPDQLYRRLALFAELRDLRKRLSNSDTFAEAAASLGELLPQVENAATSQEDEDAVEPPDSKRRPESDADTFDRILGKPVSDEPAAQSAAKAGMSRLIDEIVAPYIVAGPDPRQDEYLKSVDDAIAGQLRAILHDESFQSLESSWRGLQYLVYNVASSEELKVYLWDVTKADLLATAESSDDNLADSHLYQRVVTASEEEPWSLLVGDYAFDASDQDVALLGRLGAIAAHCGGPLLAHAEPELAACKSWLELSSQNAGDVPEGPDNWRALRASSVASWIGLAGPRFLLRQPYGSGTDPIDSFAFEEVADLANDHDAFLWGNSAWFCATLIGVSFLERQWTMEPGDHLELGDLPAVTYDEDGEKRLKPGAEAYLPERVAERILNCGLMPLLSFKNRNAVRLLRFQSIANPSTSLSGPWSQ